MYKKLSYQWGTAQCTTSVEFLSTAAMSSELLIFTYSIGHNHFLSVVSGNNISILHHFPDITTFTVHDSLRPLEVLQLKLQATCTFQFICKDAIDITCYTSWGMAARKVLDRSDLQSHSRAFVLVPFNMLHAIFYRLQLQLCLCFVPFLR